MQLIFIVSFAGFYFEFMLFGPLLPPEVTLQRRLEGRGCYPVSCITRICNALSWKEALCFIGKVGCLASEGSRLASPRRNHFLRCENIGRTHLPPPINIT